MGLIGNKVPSETLSGALTVKRWGVRLADKAKRMLFVRLHKGRTGAGGGSAEVTRNGIREQEGLWGLGGGVGGFLRCNMFFRLNGGG